MNGTQNPAIELGSDRALNSLFPMPLSPFEQYMVADDSNAYPMSFVLIITLRGNLDRAVFEQAVTFALHRHPLLMSRIGKVRGKGLCWIPESQPVVPINWQTGDKSIQPPSQERIDLYQEIGIRIWVNWSEASSELVVQFHHACTDGLGGVQFIGDLLAYYGQKTAPEGAELPEIEPINFERLLARAEFTVPETAPVASQPKQPSKLFSCPIMLGQRLIKLLRRCPVPLAAAKRRTSLGSPLLFPAIVSRMIERPVLQQLKVAAARQSVELNDLYLLEMFQSIREWNQRFGKGHDDQWLRIGMPTSLRTPMHDQMPAANVVSYMFLTRKTEECNRPDELLAGIHRQTSKIVNDRQGQFLANGLKWVLKIPGLLWCLLRLNRCFTSVILTNVGDIRRQFTARFPLKQARCVAGNVTLEVLTGAVPVRPNTRVSTSVGTYGGNLYINMHCDPFSFTKEQAEEFADLYLNLLKGLIPADVAADRQAA